MIGGLISGTIGGLYSIASGIANKVKAGKLAGQSFRPVYNVPGEIDDNKRLAQLAANTGLGTAEYNSAMSGIDRSTAAGISGLQQQRNSMAGIGNIISQSNDATLALNAQDDAVRRQNRSALYDANNNLAQYKDKAFQYNKADKYKQEQDIISGLRGVANQNVGNGVNNLSNLGMAAFMSKNKN